MKRRRDRQLFHCVYQVCRHMRYARFSCCCTRTIDWLHVIVVLLLLASSILLKYTIWQQPPQIFNDSPGYLVPAASLLNGHGYGIQQDGFRTPTYPLFLALVLAPFDRASFATCTDAHSAPCI